MDGMYGLHSSTATDYSDKTAAAALMMSPENLLLNATDYHHHEHELSTSGFFETFHSNRITNPIYLSDDLLSSPISASASLPHHHHPPEFPRDEDDMSSLMKARIASHPSYPRLLQTYIDCQKVGAPPDIAGFLDEIRRENGDYKGEGLSTIITTCLGADPELDEFMETYCDMLLKYKSDLERPFDEANSFLSEIEMQLRNLCTGASITTLSANEGAPSSDEELSGGEVEAQEAARPSSEDGDLKDKLLRKFGSHISTLKLEFSKKKKKGKLPKEARQTLLQWWNLHYKWPYPTEADKIALAESTGLDQKQINNWFINQRKRHWKPSGNMQFSVVDNISGQFYTDE